MGPPTGTATILSMTAIRRLGPADVEQAELLVRTVFDDAGEHHDDGAASVPTTMGASTVLSSIQVRDEPPVSSRLMGAVAS